MLARIRKRSRCSKWSTQITLARKADFVRIANLELINAAKKCDQFIGIVLSNRCVFCAVNEIEGILGSEKGITIRIYIADTVCRQEKDRYVRIGSIKFWNRCPCSSRPGVSVNSSGRNESVKLRQGHCATAITDTAADIETIKMTNRTPE